MVSDRPDVVRAAGCVVWRRVDGAVRMAIVHRPRYDDWSHPKGKLDPGETEQEAAIREIEEETGFRGEIGQPLTTAEYVDHRGRPKTVHYWLMEQTGGSFEENDEVDELRWCLPGEAAELLSYPYDRALVSEAVALLDG